MTASGREPVRFVLGGSAALLALLLMTFAYADACSNVRQVTTTALGEARSHEDEALADAITAAINQAITQVRGVYVTSRSELWTELADGVLHEVSTEAVSSRFAGFVPQYEVIETRRYGDGAVEVTLRASVCLDERIAIGLDARDVARRAFLSTLARDVEAAGWKLVTSAPTGGASDSQLLEFTMANGVTYIARGSSSVTFGRSRAYDTATLTLSMNLIDTRTMQVAHSLDVSASGLGSSREAALQDAALEAGEDVARAWNRRFMRSADREQSVFVFRGVHRNGTRLSLEDIVANLAGVLTVRASTFDAARREVRLTVELSDDPCVVARHVPEYRRVVTHLEQCVPERAQFRVRHD